MITVNMIDAIKVKFIKPIFEDDFPDKGMVAWLTDIKWDDNQECYELFFDFSEFEDVNKKYFKAEYYPNKHTKTLEEVMDRKRFTAIEAGMYEPKYSVYFSISSNQRDDDIFEQEIMDYLIEVPSLVCEKGIYPHNGKPCLGPGCIHCDEEDNTK